MCLVAMEPCGCTAWISVLGYGHDDTAYKQAGQMAKKGLAIHHQTVDQWKAEHEHFYCSDHHPDGPPWWKRNGGKKRPKEYATQTAAGL